MHRKWRKRVVTILFAALLLVLGTCCYEIYLTDRSFFGGCTDEGNCPHSQRKHFKDHLVVLDSEKEDLNIKTNDKEYDGFKTTTYYSTTHEPSLSTTKSSTSKSTNENSQSLPNGSVHEDAQEAKKSYFHDSLQPLPKILWWDFYAYSGGKNQTITCKGGVKCHVVSSRNFTNHPDTKAIIHYGTHIDFMDLPKTRNPEVLWGLIHEESMKNADYLYNHEEILSLFNYTATFKRQSDYPLTTNFLPEISYLQSTEYLVPVDEKNRRKLQEGLAPIFYIQSDCGVPSNRDRYVELLQKYIRVDSYGQCNNNKKLPKHLTFEKSMQPMLEKEFYQLGAKYKFTLAMENGVCDDYITEKIWRPLFLGSIPIIFGSPKIKDFLPSPKSAIVINDFNITDLVALINYLDQNDTAYNEYLQFKNKDGITNGYLKEVMSNREWSYTDHQKPFYSFFPGFECFICEQAHKVLTAKKQGIHFSKVATLDHYGCPAPKKFDDAGRYSINDKRFSYHWDDAKYKAKAFRYFYDNHLNYTIKSIENLASSFRKESDTQ